MLTESDMRVIEVIKAWGIKLPEDALLAGIRPGVQYTLVLRSAPADRQPTIVHTVADVSDDGVVRWVEGGFSSLLGILRGDWKRVPASDAAGAAAMEPEPPPCGMSRSKRRVRLAPRARQTARSRRQKRSSTKPRSPRLASRWLVIPMCSAIPPPIRHRRWKDSA